MTIMERIERWYRRHVWKSMSDTAPMRGTVKCNECGWDGKYNAMERAEASVRGHLMRAHNPDEGAVANLSWDKLYD
jgi:hypothetical protein